MQSAYKSSCDLYYCSFSEDIFHAPFDKFYMLLLRLHKNREAQMDFSFEIFSAIPLPHRISRNIVHCSMLFLRMQLLFAILFILFYIFDIPYAYFLQTFGKVYENVPQYHMTYHD